MNTQARTGDSLYVRMASRLAALRPATIFLAVAFALVGLSVRIHPFGIGVDQSFFYAFNYAAGRGLVWGQEFISTYGPYGYILEAMDVADLPIRRLGFNLLLLVGTGIAVGTYLELVPGLRRATQITLGVALIYCISLQSHEYRWFSVFLLVFLTSLRASTRMGGVYYSIASVLAGFYLLIRFSLGLGAVITVALGCLLTRQPVIAASRMAIALAAAGSAFLVGWLAQGSDLGAVGPYVRSGWELTSGYSSAMSLAPDGWLIGVLSFLLWLVFLSVWMFVEGNQHSLLSFAGLIFPLFLAWKHSIVRQGVVHGHIPLKFGMFVMVVLLADTLATARWRRLRPMFVVLTVLLLTPWLAPLGGTVEWGGYPLVKALTRPLVLSGVKDLVRLVDFQSYREGVARISAAQLRQVVLPQGMRSIIGAGSIDIYPSEVSYVPANGLSWINRPLAAAFSTYTPALDNLNATFFASDRAPEFLLWHTEGGMTSVDSRYVLWDEPLTVRAVLSRYDVIERDSQRILFRRRSEPRRLLPELVGVVEVGWNDWVSVPEANGILLAAPSVRRIPVVRLFQRLFREEPVYISLRFAGGEEGTYRVVPENMGNGLWISPFAVTPGELWSVLSEMRGRQVVAVQFSGGGVSKLGSSIRLSWFRVAPDDWRGGAFGMNGESRGRRCRVQDDLCLRRRECGLNG